MGICLEHVNYTYGVREINAYSAFKRLIEGNERADLL